MKIKYNPKFLQIGAGWLVNNVEAVLIMCTPLLSPLPSMFAAMRALDRAGWQHANLIGGIVEAMGLTAGVFVGMVESHNHRHPDNRVSPWWGRGVFAFYFLVVEALILSGDPNVVSALLPGLTLVGSVIVGFRNLMRRADERQAEAQAKRDSKDDARQAHEDAEFNLSLEIKRREAEQRLELQRLQAEQRMEIERQKAEAKLAQPLPQPVAQPPQPTATSGATRPDELLRLLSDIEDPNDINKAELGRMFGVSRTQIGKDIDKLIDAGKLTINGKVKVHQ